MKIDPSEIIVDDGFRSDPSIGLADLCESIRELGQLVPVLVNADYRLIDGERRLLACKTLGIDVEFNIATNLDDAVRHLKAQRDANGVRLPWTPSEMVAIGKRLEELLKPEAEKRQKELGKSHGTPSSNLDEGVWTGRTDEQVASAVGIGKGTYRKAKAVVESGNKDLVVAMDAKQVSIDTAAKVAKLPEEKQKQVLQEAATAKNPRKAAAKAVEQIQMPPERPHVDDCIKFRAMFDKLYSRWSSDEAKQVMRQFFRQLANEV